MRELMDFWWVPAGWVGLNILIVVIRLCVTRGRTDHLTSHFPSDAATTRSNGGGGSL